MCSGGELIYISVKMFSEMVSNRFGSCVTDSQGGSLGGAVSLLRASVIPLVQCPVQKDLWPWDSMIN